MQTTEKDEITRTQQLQHFGKMNNCPTISVVIPCYNDGFFLTKALESVSSQTLQPLEILVINDGSTESRTVKLFQNLNRARVTVINQENRGLAGARNTGIRTSQGTYIYFLDADDLMYPECLAKLADLMEENPDAIAAASRIRILGGPFHGTDWCEPANPYLLLVNNLLCAGILLRRDAAQKYDIWYDESMRHGYEDWELNIRLLETGKSILFYPEPLYQYRQRRKSLLSTARQRHVEILSYIRSKHRNLYTSENLIALKRIHAPALQILSLPDEPIELMRFLNKQTFRDWILNALVNQETNQNIRYQFHYSNIHAIQRLPPEALESVMMALEAYPSALHCVVAVKHNVVSWLANAGKIEPLDRSFYPVAIVTRNAESQHNILSILSNCQLLVEFPDLNDGADFGWDSISLKFSAETVLSHTDLIVLRKRLSQSGKQLLGSKFQERCVRLYDWMYRSLVSQKTLAFRQRLRNYVGKRAERLLSNAFYRLFLMKPPTDENKQDWQSDRSFSRLRHPLFVREVSPSKPNILITTGWFTEGGVEQEILDLCNHLRKSRFRIVIATTLPSSHPWDHLARKTGASVYHLADILRPTAIPNGLLHFVLNHHVDCLYVVHSRAAYESLGMLKNNAPWLPVVDRNVILDPGGGFPLLSAKVAKNLVDLRTVGHKKLAEHMSVRYHLPLGSLRVIYAGTDIARIENTSFGNPGSLREMCHVSTDTPMVVFVGRLVPQKRPDIFVRSVAKIFGIEPACKAHFAMIGDGDLMPSVKALISKFDLSGRIHMLGTHPDVLELITDSTVLMMPSAYEGLALVSYEAMALGIPQIFANVNGQAELITSETGVLIGNGPGEETRYAQACLDLLSDPDRRARMAAAGKERIRSQFTAENAVKQYSEIFEEMAAMSRKRRSEIPHLEPPHINPLRDAL